MTLRAIPQSRNHVRMTWYRYHGSKFIQEGSPLAYATPDL